jgi:hypothetical protein
MADVLEGSGRVTHAYTAPEDGSGGPTRSWRAMQPDFKARVACADCNNGWMSDLERAAQRRVPPLVHGIPSHLSRHDCGVLARWAAKTALMFQASQSSENRLAPQQICKDLRAAPNPSGLPPTLRVWIGSVEARGAWSQGFAGTVEPRRGDAVPYFTALLTFDRLAFMVTGCDDARVLESLNLGRLGHAWTQTSQRRSGVRWPPSYTFPADQFPAMAQLFEQLASIRAP